MLYQAQKALHVITLTHLYTPPCAQLFQQNQPPAYRVKGATGGQCTETFAVYSYPKIVGRRAFGPNKTGTH